MNTFPVGPSFPHPGGGHHSAAIERREPRCAAFRNLSMRVTQVRLPAHSSEGGVPRHLMTPQAAPPIPFLGLSLVLCLPVTLLVITSKQSPDSDSEREQPGLFVTAIAAGLPRHRWTHRLTTRRMDPEESLVSRAGELIQPHILSSYDRTRPALGSERV